jgi:hypothetical protein
VLLLAGLLVKEKLEARSARLDVVLDASPSGNLVVKLLQLGVRPQHLKTVHINNRIDGFEAGNVRKRQVLWQGKRSGSLRMERRKL